MSNVAILDNSWGDCGKGRIVHTMSPNFDFCIRFAGSSNSGHVVYRDGKKYTHHLLPSADYRNKKIKSFLANGMVINLEELLSEILEFEKDFPGMAESIYVDPDAFVITDKHIEIDKNNNKHIGSTGKGVQPAYTDKVSRCGTRIYNYIKDNAEVIKKLKLLGVKFVPVLAMREEFEMSNLLFEGAQSILLDLNCGPNYPFVTSSDCTISGIMSAGFNFIKLDKVYGCMKPYLTKVGAGDFPTEYFGEEAETLRKIGGEYGATTGRPRRCGALDLVALKYGTAKGGINSLILTKMDILNGQKFVKVCSSYGKEVFSPSDFYDLKPEYINLPGWNDSKDPKQTEAFFKYVEAFIGAKIEMYSTGVEDKDLLERNTK